LITPDSGQVQLPGGSPTAAANRHQIGMAPQSLSLYEELTGRENLAFFGRLYGLAARQLHDRVGWALQVAGLEDRATDRVGTYSGGMKRRLNIAVALIHQPSLLLLDEPTVGVDPQSRNHIFEWMERLKSEGMTLVYTTHYMEEAQRLCDRVAIIDHGKLLAQGKVEDLITRFGGLTIVSGVVRQIPMNVQMPGSLIDSAWRMEVEQPFELLHELTQQGVRFESLQITPPDLEGVFLKLTGRGLRD